jgi:hypothetical protein
VVRRPGADRIPDRRLFEVRGQCPGYRPVVGIDAQLRRPLPAGQRVSRDDILAAIPDRRGVFRDLVLAAYNRGSSPAFGRLSPYGDAVFESTDLAELLDELASLERLAITANERSVVRTIRDLALRSEREGLELHFLGD